MCAQRCSRRLIATVIVVLWVSQGVTAEQGVVRLPLRLPSVEVVVGPDSAAVFDAAGTQWVSLPGEPDIPWRVMTVLLPPDAALDTVAARLEQARFQPEDGCCSVAPTPPDVTWRDGEAVQIWPQGKRIVDGRDVAIYQSDARWPREDVRLLSAGRKRGWRLAQVAVPLVNVNPVKESVERLTSAQLVISYGREPEADGAEQADLRGAARVRRLAANFDQQEATYRQAAVNGELGISLQSQEDPGYAIITTKAIADSAADILEDFCDHKELRGFTVITKTTDPNDPNWYDPNTAPDKIRGWLQDNYVTSSIEYVLLIGNPDPCSTDPNCALPMASGIPTDLYYAELTEDFQQDPNEVDPNGIDLHFEVLVGRIPCYTSEPNWVDDLEGILQKIIDYQTEDPNDTGWRSSALLVAKPFDENTPVYQLGEEIKDDVLLPEGWSYYRVYDGDYGLDPPPDANSCTVENVTTGWTTGDRGLVVWGTHGQATSAGGVMDLDHVGYLDDDHPSFTFQVSCWNARPDFPNNLAYELLKNGGICTIGATQPAFYKGGRERFAGTRDAAGMSFEYAARVVVGGLTSGEALYELKELVQPTMMTHLLNYLMFNLYGDPETYIFEPVVSSDPNDRVHNATQDAWYADIQLAIDDANDGDVVVLNPGTYQGDDNRDLDFGGKAITVRGSNPYDPNVVAATIIDPNGDGCGFVFDDGEDANAVVSGLTIINGSAANGAGIYCDASSPTIRYCMIRDCTATTYGGGIYLQQGSDARISHCVVQENAAYSAGGIACAESSPTIYNCAICENSTTGTILSYGAGIAFYGSGSPTMTSCYITGNEANVHAGGICCFGACSPSIESCMITQNAAGGSGGGVYCLLGTSPTLINCTIAGNSASDYAGGLYCHNSNPTLVNSILWDDTCDDPNLGPEIALGGSSTLEPLYCDVEGGPNDVYADDSNYFVWDPNVNYDVDPCFIDPNDDYHLAGASDCVDAGDPNRNYLGQLDVDLEVRVMGDGVDIGADEYSGNYTCGDCGAGFQPLIPLLAMGGFWLLRRQRGL